MNITKAIKRIKIRQDKKITTYGLFIDFTNAYNTIHHRELFEKLEMILPKEDSEFIKALLSRIELRVGNSGFHPNRGVPQGSTIFSSPIRHLL